MAEKTPTSAYRDPGQAAAGGSAEAASLLRRRKDPKKNRFGAASKAIGAMMDMTKKVRLEAITSTLQDVFGGDQRKRQDKSHPPAPPGITHAYSVTLTHVIAPLWAVGAKSIGVDTPIAFNDPKVTNFCRTLDQKGWDIEFVGEVATQDPMLATVYICLLLAKLLCLEHGEWRLNFVELAGQIQRDVRHKREYEEQANDEISAHDQARRRLVEVGGAWRPRGAIELEAPLNALRQLTMQRCMFASVVFRYTYTDENLQSLTDALASQLFLVSYSETLVQLVAGVKGPAYVSKYFLHVARAEAPSTDSDSYLVEPNVPSTALEAVNTAVDLAVANIVHRNDTGDLVIMALVKALSNAPHRQLRSLLKIVKEVFSLICCADLSILVQILDALRPCMLQPEPIGSEAKDVMKVVWSAIRNVGAPSRRLMSTLFVAGDDMRSFRRRPAHVLTAPYCARSFLMTRLFHSEIGLQRGINPALPVALPANIDPATGLPLTGMLDDSVLYISNNVVNIFQSSLELVSHLMDDDLTALAQTAEQETEKAAADSVTQKVTAISNLQIIDLPTLFSLPPMSICGFLPMLHMLLHPGTQVVFSDPEHTKGDTLMRISEQYLVLVDGNKPVKGQRRFRLEAPRLPARPLLISVATENEEGMTTLKNVIDRHWKHCDQRISDREPAYLHPKRDLSLAHFIESDLDLVVVGGTGTFRRFCETLLRLRLQYPGNVPTIRLYLIPSGFDNDVAAWLARNDPLYLHRIYAPLTCMPQSTCEAQSAEALAAEVAPSLESLALREKINHFLAHATVPNEVVIYQVECINLDGTSVYIAMTANFEIGAHVTAAVIHDAHTSSKDQLSTQPFIGLSQAQAARGVQGRPQRTRSFANRPTGLEPVAAFEPDASQAERLRMVAAGFIEQHTTMTRIRLSDTVRESAEKILTRIHASFRGMSLGTRRHPSEARDVPFCCSGVDVLDWISTTFHLYDSKASQSAAQILVDHGVLICAAAAPGKPADRFAEQSLYSPRQREEPDYIPTSAPAARSGTFDLAMSLKQGVEEVTANRTAANGGVPFALKSRVVFVPRASDPTYRDLLPKSGSGASAPTGGQAGPEANVDTRDIAVLKLKSMGATGDRGAAPDPTACQLQLAIYDMDRKRAEATYSTSSPVQKETPSSPGNPASPSPDRPGASGSSRPSNVGQAAELGDHYRLQFGSSAGAVDPKCVLSIDVVDDGVSTAAGGSPSSGTQMGTHCCIDGDVFGPFIGFRIRPALIGESAATVPLMSFLACAPPR